MKSKNNSQDLGLDLSSFSIGWKKPRQRDAKPDVKPSQPPGPRLKDCLDLIIEKADEIIHTPEYFWCRPWESYWMRMYLGRFDLPLGVLAAKWASGELVFPYGQHKRSLYVYSSMGSPLSGSGNMRGMLKNDDGYTVVTHSLSHKDLPSDFSISLSQAWLKAKNEYGAQVEKGMELAEVVQRLS